MFICIVAFFSGLAGLAYEVLWYREFALLLGNTAHASSLVLAAVFGGLALGNALAGRWTNKHARPLLAYAVLELGMALCAGSTLIIKAWGGDLRLPTFFLFLAAMAILMGGTLPFLMQSLEDKRPQLGKDAPRLYGINTAGAMLGALLAAFFLPVTLGIRGRFLFLILINLGLALITVRRSMGEGRAKIHVEEGKTTGSNPLATARLKMFLLPAFLSGVGTLALEVFWRRMFSLVFQNSVYSFSLILLFALFALALAAAWAGRLVRLGGSPLHLMGLSLCFVSIAVPLGAWLFFEVSDLRFLLRDAGPLAYVSQIVLFTGCIVLPVMIPAGMVLPLCWTIDGRAETASGWRMGSILGINTLGGILGALASGFLLLPHLGLWPGLGLIALSYALGAILIFSFLPVKGRKSSAYATAMAAGLVLPILLIWPSLPVQHLKKGETLLWLEQGAEAQVAVVHGASGGRLLKVNNTYNLGNTMAEAEERRMGQIPLLHPHPRRVAFVGVATGITASAVYDHPVVDHVTLIELLPEVVRAANYFEAENRGLLRNRRWETVVADGRIVIPKRREQFDAIISSMPFSRTSSSPGTPGPGRSTVWNIIGRPLRSWRPTVSTPSDCRCIKSLTRNSGLSRGPFGPSFRTCRSGGETFLRNIPSLA